MASNEIMFCGHLNYFQNPPLGGRPNTKLRDHGTPNVYNRWFSLFYHVWGHVWTYVHWNSIWLRARPHMTSHYTWVSMTMLHGFGGVFRQMVFGHFLLGSHSSMVTTLGLCVKWPLVPNHKVMRINTKSPKFSQWMVLGYQKLAFKLVLRGWVA